MRNKFVVAFFLNPLEYNISVGTTNIILRCHQRLYLPTYPFPFSDISYQRSRRERRAFSEKENRSIYVFLKPS